MRDTLDKYRKKGVRGDSSEKLEFHIYEGVYSIGPWLDA